MLVSSVVVQGPEALEKFRNFALSGLVGLFLMFSYFVLFFLCQTLYCFLSISCAVLIFNYVSYALYVLLLLLDEKSLGFNLPPFDSGPI